ncbi:unnamed protein product [Microthlaspi erraticum]|uniref:non-specific serine/threonine protein kinase n=1 Tax=Microthlaspi erraticum TaxID=1685480 RepID=A0A6D2L6T9_9BRAS|nr:unnamed protein product [Microthlaspi erraticum]
MFSAVLFSKPKSCLVFLFFFSSFHHLPCALSQKEIRVCESLFHCGNITVGFPFWGEARPEPCGHPSLGLRCNPTSKLTFLIISGLMYRVLQVNSTASTLKLARQDFLGEFCNASFSGATLTPELFELLPDYKTLYGYYLCDYAFHNSTSFTCPKTALAFVRENDEYHENCGGSFNITVPTSYALEEKALIIAHLESVLKEGFEVKLKIDERPCRECNSSGRICAYEAATPVCCNTNSSSEHKCTHMIPSRSSADDPVDERHILCARWFSCGNQKELSYPFWTPDREECGHPDFKVNCGGDSAEFNISSVKFQILQVNYYSSIIKLARKDYLKNLCSKYPERARIIQDILPIHGDTTELVTFYYDCPDPMENAPPNDYIRQLNCEDGNGTQSYYAPLPSNPRERAVLRKFNAECKTKFNIPVSRSALRIAERNQSLEAMKEALDEGFELSFNNECSKCVKSMGACGYNQRSNRFVCYCRDKPHKHTCHSDAGLSKKAKIGIGFACGFVGATLLVGGGVFCFLNWRRKKQASQYTSKGLSSSSTTPYSSKNTISTTTISGSSHSLVTSMSNLANASDYFGVQVFSYEELEEATENFSRELGDGGFGTVYYGILKDGRAVAVKRLFERSIKRVEQFKNEIEILKSLKHPNLVILYGCTTRHSRELLLVYEYISNGTLADHLHGDQAQSRPICWPGRLGIAIQTASALSFLHASGIIHRDVKTTNILLDSNNQVKVADFGLSRLFPTDQTHISTAPQGTPGYVDPEYYQCYRLNEKSDVYSFGVVLSELISSKEAVDITRHRHDINLANMAISKIQNDAVHELVDLSLGFARDPAVKRMMMSVAELAFRCLQQEREVRPSMDEVVEVLRGIQKEGIPDSPDVVEIDVSGGDDVGLLTHGVPPPLSPVTEKGTSTSSTNTTASSF